MILITLHTQSVLIKSNYKTTIILFLEFNIYTAGVRDISFVISQPLYDHKHLHVLSLVTLNQLLCVMMMSL